MYRAALLILVLLAHELCGLTWFSCPMPAGGGGCGASRESGACAASATRAAPGCCSSRLDDADSCGTTGEESASGPSCCSATSVDAEPEPDASPSCCGSPGRSNSGPASAPIAPKRSCGTVCVLPPGVTKPDACPARCCVVVPERPAAPGSESQSTTLKQTLDAIARVVIVTEIAWGDAATQRDASPRRRAALGSTDARVRRARLCIRTI